MITYFLIRLFLLPFAIMPHRMIHAIGKILGTLLYYLIPKFRKRALSNLSLAKDLHLSQKEIRKIAKKSFHNLAITCLEYPKFAISQSIEKTIICENPETADALIAKGQGIVFFVGHQSNWEVLFLDGTRRMPGVAIGRPIKNLHLYNWILKMRSRFGGTIVEPKKGIGKGLRALREGKFMGIVGDQALPEVGYLSTFLGRRAWTSPAPAILAYKTKSPLMVATTKRKQGKYFIHYSDPIWPNPEKSLEEETSRMMDEVLTLFAASIKECPEQWLWQHNRWKQETPKNVYYRYRHDTILIIFSAAEEFALTETLRKIYPSAFLTFLLPETDAEHFPKTDCEIITYASEKEKLLPDYDYKLVIDFTASKKVASHYKKRAAHEIVSMKNPSPENLLKTLCREHMHATQ